MISIYTMVSLETLATSNNPAGCSGTLSFLETMRSINNIATLHLAGVRIGYGDIVAVSTKKIGGFEHRVQGPVWAL